MHVNTVNIHNFRSCENVLIDMKDYSLLIGANNAGKSNIIDAIRVFYDYLRYDENRDLPKFKCQDEEVWIDIEYSLTDEEYISLKTEYQQPTKRLKVRKWIKTNLVDAKGKPRQGIYGYVGDKIAEEHFYGARNVQQGKLGKLIYIPAASNLSEHTKMTGPSPLRDLLGDVANRLVSSSSAFKVLMEQFETFAKAFKTEETDDKRSLATIEQNINSGLKEWDIAFKLSLEPDAVKDDLLKSFISHRLIDPVLENAELKPEQFGQGLQRHLIFTLIRLAASLQIESSTSTDEKKEFSPQLNLLLFEEPEAFLHPTQQGILYTNLQIIAKQPNSQVLISSHSPHFVSYNADDMTGIIRLHRQSGKTCVGQLSKQKLKDIFQENLEINALLRDVDSDSYNPDIEALQYFMWLDPDRSGIFFAKHVLLVEGATERVLLNYLLKQGLLKPPLGGIYILDCASKYNIHRFMNLLGELKVSHSVLHDGDLTSKFQQKINKLIQDSRNPYTVRINAFPNDIENFLGVDTPQFGKPQRLMLRLKDGSVSDSKLEAFVKKVNDLISI